MKAKRKYTYRNSGFADMRDRIEKKKKEETEKVYKVCPWKTYVTA